MLLTHRFFRVSVICLFIVAAIIGYRYWAVLVIQIVEWQQTFHALLSQHIQSFQEEPLRYGVLLAGVSLAYGVFHAAGPGHGKAVLITYLSTQKENVTQGLKISFAAAVLQALVAIVLVSIVSIFLNQTFRQTNALGTQVELASYGLVILVGLYLTGRSIVQFFRKSHQHAHAHQDVHHTHDDHLNHHHEDAAHNHEAHVHDEHCNHSYVPEAKLSFWQSASVALSMGLRPCSGAVVVLIYANLVGVYWIGIVSTLLMGLGTGLTVALLGWLSVIARRYLQNTISTDHEHNHRFEQILSFTGGIILIVLGWSLIQATLTIVEGHPLF